MSILQMKDAHRNLGGCSRWEPRYGRLSLIEQKKNAADFAAEPISLIAHQHLQTLRQRSGYVGKGLKPEDTRERM